MRRGEIISVNTTIGSLAVLWIVAIFGASGHTQETPVPRAEWQKAIQEAFQAFKIPPEETAFWETVKQDFEQLLPALAPESLTPARLERFRRDLPRLLQGQASLLTTSDPFVKPEIRYALVRELMRWKMQRFFESPLPDPAQEMALLEQMEQMFAQVRKRLEVLPEADPSFIGAHWREVKERVAQQIHCAFELTRKAPWSVAERAHWDQELETLLNREEQRLAQRSSGSPGPLTAVRVQGVIRRVLGTLSQWAMSPEKMDLPPPLQKLFDQAAQEQKEGLERQRKEFQEEYRRQTLLGLLGQSIEGAQTTNLITSNLLAAVGAVWTGPLVGF